MGWARDPHTQLTANYPIISGLKVHQQVGPSSPGITVT